MSPVYLFFLPALVCGKMAVHIDVRTDPPLIDISGYSLISLPEKERPLFKLEDAQLKKSVANYSGAAPSDVFVRNGWGDLYKTFDWQEIQRTIKPTLKTKTTTKTSPQNCSEVPLESGRNLTVSSIWSNNTISTNETIDYQIIHDYGKLTFNSSWGEEVDAFQSYRLPTSKLSRRCTFDVYLKYEASIFGDVAVNYMAKREGHHFWAFDVNRVQAAAGLPTALFHQETITVEYYR